MCFDVECKECSCKFISKEINPFKYCPNCRRWLTIKDVRKIRMVILFHLIEKYYKAIKEGKKTTEYRKCSAGWGYWEKRLLKKEPQWNKMPLELAACEGANITLDSFLKPKIAWFVLGYPKGNLPRLEADIIHLSVNPRTAMFHIDIDNVKEIQNGI